MNTLFPLLIITALLGLVFSLVIWLVSRLGLGLEVGGFGSALVAGILIAFVAGAITVLLGLAGVQDGDGLIGGIVHLITAAVAMLVIARFLPGLRVAGIGGALVAAATIGAVYWLGGLALGMIV